MRKYVAYDKKRKVYCAIVEIRYNSKTGDITKLEIFDGYAFKKVTINDVELVSFCNQRNKCDELIYKY